MTMNENAMINAMYAELKCVQVRFKGNSFSSQKGVNDNNLSHKEYSYKTFLDLKIGDEVIVHSPSAGFVVVVVCGSDTSDLDSKRLKWVLQKVEVEEYEENQEKETQAFANLRNMMSETRRKKAMSEMKEMLGLSDLDDKQLIEQLSGSAILEEGNDE